MEFHVILKVQEILKLIHKIQKINLEKENSWKGILSSIIFTIRSMVQTIKQHT